MFVRTALRRTSSDILQTDFSVNLTKSQLAALDYFTDCGRAQQDTARESLSDIMYQSDIAPERFDQAIAKIKSHARVGLHFHPDRPDPHMKPVAQALLEQGTYRNQFVTQMSSGGETAYTGGDRDKWEEKLFGGAYHINETSDDERPKYGALDLMLHPDGPSPRFGCCFLLLKPDVSKRTTFTYLDSSHSGTKGTYEAFYGILAALMKDAFFSDFAIGERNLTTGRLVEYLLTNLELPFADPSGRAANRNLNHYIEAQVHGDISLSTDADVLVIDPSFRKTHIGELLQEMCSVYSIDCFWHMGFSLSSEEVPSDFRGPVMPPFAKHVAIDGCVDPSTIGSAAMDLRRNPAEWSDWGEPRKVRGLLKYLWHVLVRYGEPFRSS